VNWYRKAQDDENEDILGEAIVDSIYPDIPASIAPEHRVCETFYDIEGFRVRLFIAASQKKGYLGATEDLPSRVCLDINDGSINGAYFREFPLPQEATEIWGADQYLADEGRYKHQCPGGIVGPGLDLLPNGRATFMEYLSEVIPMMKLRMERFNQLPAKGSIMSKWDRKDKYGDRTVMFFEISPSSISYPIGDKYVMSVDRWWKALREVLFSTGKMRSMLSESPPSWESLTPQEFKAIKETLEGGIAAGSFIPRSP
jgi:hypothetical protein